MWGKVCADRIIFHHVFGSVFSLHTPSATALPLKQFSSHSDDVFLPLLFHFLLHRKIPPLGTILSCLPSIIQKKKKKKKCKNWGRAGMTSLICAWALQCACTVWLFMTRTSNPHRIQLPWWDVFLWGFRFWKRDLSMRPIVKNVQCSESCSNGGWGY